MKMQAKQIYVVEVVLDGAVIARQEVPSRQPIKYLLDHPRSKYTKQLKEKLLNSGVSWPEINFILSLEPDDEDEAIDKMLDEQDAPDGSSFLDNPTYPT